MEFITSVNSFLNDIVWGPYMLVLLVGTGIFVSIRLKLFQVTRIGVWCKGTFGSLNKRYKSGANITPFQAVTTALASTVGTGNIVGVATAIVAGGPGAVFWMWVSAFFGMMTKFAEIVLAVKFREVDKDGVHYGGPMYYIEKGLKCKWLAVVFAVLGALACFGIGNMTQVNSIATTVQETFGVAPIIVGIVVAAIVFLVVIGGIKRIAKVTEKLVPFMAVFYFIGGIVVIIMNAGKLGAAFNEIFAGAFSLQSVGGGLMGYVIAQAMRYGFARGVFSNEAGLGSAPIAHAASSTNEPVKQGLWGIFEVFVDTIIICTITALTILVSGAYTGAEGLNGAALTLAAFEQALPGVAQISGYFVTIAMICFALSTILGWAYYGERCIGYIFKGNKIADLAYKILFVGLVVVGAVGGLTLIWDIADTLNGMMAIPNLIAVIALNGVVVAATKDYLDRRKKGIIK